MADQANPVAIERKLTSQPERFEVLVLGSGFGGKLLAWHMARSGRRTAVVERRWIGGSCPNIACLPSKNEIWSAEVAHLAQHAAQVRHDDHRSRDDRHGKGSPAQARHGRPRDRPPFAELQDERRRTDHGEWAFCGTENARSAPERRRHASAGGRPSLPQPRNARGNSGRCWPRDGPAAHSYRSSRTRLSATASDRARRRLCRARIGTGVPSLRQPRDGRRARASAHEPRGSRRCR